MPDKKPDPVDATTTVSPQPSIDPVYQAGKTVGATDKSPRPPRAAAPSNLRSVLPRGSRPRNVDYPGTLYHPVLGARYVNDSNEANELPGPAHNWWPTAEEADMHRTDLEAQEVIHHARSWKNEVNLASTVNEKTGEVTVEDTNKPVRYSVQAEEVLKRGGVEPH
jgi:hypothetical protein